MLLERRPTGRRSFCVQHDAARERFQRRILAIVGRCSSLYRGSMRNQTKQSPNGFILIEALVALVIIGVVFLGLEGSLTIVLRSLADSERQAIATRIAETQRERAFAAGCVAGSGSDSANAVAVEWTISPAGALVHVTQIIRYPQKLGVRVEHYDAIGTCR